MISPEMFKALVKLYSGDRLHEQFGRKLISGKYDQIYNYLSAYVDNLNQHSHTFAYTSFSEPVYRAINPQEKFKSTDYELNSIKQWPLF